MSHELEQVQTLDGTTITSFAFAGERQNIWHRLGQSFEAGVMTGEEAMRLAHMNRAVRIEPVVLPDGAQWAIEPLYQVVLEGEFFMTDESEPVVIPDKVVGVHGSGGADAHQNFSIRDRFLLAEEAIHASNGEAVWSTAGMLRDGRQGFACMEAPPIIIDPNGVADIVRQYLTLAWSFDGTRATELSSSEIRTQCANMLRMHDYCKTPVIKVKHTSHTAESRFRLAAEQWSMAQDRAKALKLQAERMLAIRDGKTVLSKIVEKFMPEKPDASKRETSLRKGRVDAIEVLAHSTTNTSVGDNGWAAYNTFVEYLDWAAPVKLGAGETEADRRLGNQFDGTYDATKQAVASFVLSLS